MTTVADLYELQEIDLAIDTRRMRLAAIEEQIGETEELIEARQEVASRQGALRELEVQQKDREERVDEARTKTSGIEKKLYEGTIRNPKELEDLQADLVALQKQVRRREDELLGLMVQVEEAQVQLQAATTTLAALEGRWTQEQGSLLAEKAELERELSELEEKRNRQSVGQDQGALELYDLLRGRKEGRAVAKVERGMCGGCRITLPMSVLQKAKAGLGLVQCVSCERILFVS
ncbi:MAG: zinc ribbon domain-containing protein [Dehalococcoidia bacterium]